MTVNTYKIFDPAAFADLIFSLDNPRFSDRFYREEFWIHLASVIESLCKIERVSQGPGHGKIVAWPVNPKSIASNGIIIQLSFNDATNIISFLYVNSDNVELHVPEEYLFSGVIATDQKRMAQFLKWLRLLEVEFGSKWSQIEWAGVLHDVELSSELLQDYASSTHERIDSDYPRQQKKE